jgi:outer membrane protein TolC
MVVLRRLLTISAVAAASLAAAGCSGDFYRHSADAQVYRLLAKRKEASLGYKPDTQIAATKDPAVPQRAFETLPTTPIPPETKPPLATRPPVDVPYGPMGPEAKWIGVPVPQDSPQGRSAQGAGDAQAQGGPRSPAQAPASETDVDRSQTSPFFYGPPSPRQPTLRLDLFKAVQYAVDHSRQYQGQVEDLYLAGLDVTLERHLLSPRPFATVGAQYTGGQRSVDYRSALAVTTNAGVRQKLPYGGEVVAEALVSFINAISDNAENGESASLALSGSVPLLRGAGMVNLEGLISSERELVYQVRAFEEFRRSFAVTISRQYFNLLAGQQAMRNRQLNYDNLAVLTERTRALFGAGRISFLEVQRSEQALLQAEDRVLSARENYQNALDSFKILLGMPVSDELAVVPVALDLNTPDLDASEAVRTADTYRLDLQTARDRIDDARRGIDNARNGLLPGLNLAASGAATNRPNDPARQLDSRTFTYSAGVTLDIPVDQLPERNVYRRALIQYERAVRALEGLKDTVTSNVLQDIRAIRSAQQSLRIQEESIELAERRLDLASELLRAGNAGGAGAARRGDARDVVEAQQDLLSAQDEYEQARADLQVQVLAFLRDVGTLRVDPAAGLIGRAMRRGGAPAAATDGRAHHSSLETPVNGSRRSE